MLHPIVALLLWFALPIQPAPPADPEVEWLAQALTGGFSSHAQAQVDPDFRDVHLQASRIWANRSDGPWLYIEQAIAGSLEAPYRQRVYRVLRLEDGNFETHVYLLPDPEKWIGEGARPDPFVSITPGDLIRREGCGIHLRHRDDGAFVGSTSEGTCPSELVGAATATSEVIIRPDLLVSWDRGWNAMHEQVWGATKAGYRFLRDRPTSSPPSE